MSVEMDQHRIRGVQERVANVLSTKEFSPAEVIFGLSEFVGRMIVGYVDGTWLTKKEVADAAAKHIALTVKIGVERGGQSTEAN